MTTEIEKYSDEGRSLLQVFFNPETAQISFDAWDTRVAAWLKKEHAGTGLSAEWSGVSVSPLRCGNQYRNSSSAWEKFGEAVRKRLEWLGSKAGKMTKANQITQRSPSLSTAQSKKVFIVHGQDEAAKEKVARFVKDMGLEPIILHEQPNKGRTIIEKLDDHADVGYAVVLLTSDDIGGPKQSLSEKLQRRARQNVIFELGFFLGRLGRDRICALYESGVEMLSDYQGVAYVPLDKYDGWKSKLADEFIAAGIDVDKNNI